MTSRMWEKLIGMILRIKLTEPWEYFDLPTLYGVVRDVKGESILVELDSPIWVQKNQINHLVVRPKTIGDSIYQLTKGKGITSALEIVWASSENKKSLFDAAESNRGFQGFIGTVIKCGRKRLLTKKMEDLRKAHLEEEKSKNVTRIREQANEAWLEKKYQTAYNLLNKIRSELSELENKRFHYLQKHMKKVR